MTGIGWVQWEPGQKHHYMLRRPDGTCWTACEMWGTTYTPSLLNMVSQPTEKKKCKLCIRALQRSDETGENNEQ